MTPQNGLKSPFRESPEVEIEVNAMQPMLHSPSPRMSPTRRRLHASCRRRIQRPAEEAPPSGPVAPPRPAASSAQPPTPKHAADPAPIDPIRTADPPPKPRAASGAPRQSAVAPLLPRRSASRRGVGTSRGRFGPKNHTSLPKRGQERGPKFPDLPDVRDTKEIPEITNLRGREGLEVPWRDR